MALFIIFSKNIKFGTDDYFLVKTIFAAIRLSLALLGLKRCGVSAHFPGDWRFFDHLNRRKLIRPTTLFWRNSTRERIKWRDTGFSLPGVRYFSPLLFLSLPLKIVIFLISGPPTR